MKSDIGEFRARVTFVDPYGGGTEELDGQPAIDPVTICTVWAQVDSVTGEEREEGERLQTVVTHRVRVRFREDIRAAGERWYILYRGRKLEVQRALDTDERRRFIELECVEQFTR